MRDAKRSYELVSFRCETEDELPSSKSNQVVPVERDYPLKKAGKLRILMSEAVC